MSFGPFPDSIPINLLLERAIWGTSEFEDLLPVGGGNSDKIYLYAKLCTQQLNHKRRDNEGALASLHDYLA
ncbi:hypothetical protein GGP41_006639 [Bipolaris sorokiniana]|uniref:Uncharacterized protein n=1 Tax=Cochliobolus sativus TaxID=45130 RepID=A0A8H6DZ99_COCSA|nr:hypothetical protein GGP41_006639 [Bipolaris sorokiniana]